MADGYISQIKTPDNKVYLLKDSEKTDENVNQISNAENKEFPIILKNTNNTIDETAGVKYAGDITVNPSNNTITAQEFKGNLNIANLIPISTKTYTTELYTSAGANYYQNFMIVEPTDYNAIWAIHYRLIVTATGHSDYTAYYDCNLSGRANTYYSYKFYNSLVNYPIYYHMYLRSNSASTPHEIGIRIASSYGADTVQKTIKVELLEQINCTATLLESLKLYTSALPSGYAAWTSFNATSNGLQETGDADTTGRDYSHSGYGINGPDFRLPPYTIFGYDKNQKAQGISLYNSGYTSSTTNLSTARVYNTVGFAWEKGLWFSNSGTNYAPNANLDFSPAEFYYAVDMRYTDNVYLHKTTTSELGIVARKPLYFRGTIENDGLFYLAPITVSHNNTNFQRVWTQDIPDSDDGYVYWFIGYAYYSGSYAASGYQVNLVTENKLYWYHDGRFQEYLPSAVKADLATTATNVTISADTTTNKEYALVFGITPSDGTNPTAAKTEGLQKNITKLYTNPSTGTLYSTKFCVDEHVTLQYNTTDSSLDFIFA